MECGKCERNLVDCICPDLEDRIADLRNSPYLAIDWDSILEERKRRLTEKLNASSKNDLPL